jgi:molecular chaperone GrpE
LESLPVIGESMKKQTTKQCDCGSEIENLQKQGEEWKNKYVRALADYQNLERRTIEEKHEIRKFAAEVVLERLLPAIDTLKRARDHIKDTGLDLAYKELIAVLQEQGVEHIKVVGDPFNPHEMECIEVVEGEDNKVIEELLPGYRLHGKILRVAQVKVGKKGGKYV